MCVKKLICLVPFVLVLGLAASTAVADLVGHWPLDGNPNDISANGYDGVAEGGVTYGEGVLGLAADFNGSDALIDCGDVPVSDTGAISIACWVKPRNIAQDWAGYVSKWTLDKAQRTFWLGQHSTDGWLRFGIYPGGPTAETSIDSGQVILANGEWTHIVCTYDGNIQRIYADGVEVVSSPERNAEIVDRGGNLRFGITRGGPTWFNGLIDDVWIYSLALTAEEIQQTMKGGIPPGSASNPSPADEATDVPRDVVLSWQPGKFADKHDVYLGTNFDDVNDASRTEDPGGVYLGRQDPNTLALDRLDLGQTYYWRIDEVNAPPDYTVYKGLVWQFTVEPVAYPIAGENITATASSTGQEGAGPENTINSSGLDANDLHSTEGTDMWLNSGEPLGAWIQYEFDKVYKLHEMWVWNYNGEGLNTIYGLKDVTIEYSANGADWTELGGVPEFAQAPGAAGYAHNTTVDLGDVVAKYVRIAANSNWSGGIMDQYGLSEVRFFYIPVYAREPAPDSGATNVSIGTRDEPIDVTLGFRAGREAAKHDVYLSTDEQAVIDGTAPVTTVTETSYGPLSLDLGTTYYWKINEVNEAETTTTWQGDIWNFTTHEFFIVDDFESYNDLDPTDPNSNRIFRTWIDGLGYGEAPPAPGPYSPGNGTGAIVGYANPPFAEQIIVHGGKQSMPFSYDNTGDVAYSEAERTFATPQDWTIKGVGALSLWFRGYPTSVGGGGSFSYDAGTDIYTIIAEGANIWGTSDQFHFAFKRLSGVGSIVAKVLSVSDSHTAAKTGVMIRETLAADSAHAMTLIQPSGVVRFFRRLTAGGSSTADTLAGITAPHWVKLERHIGGTFRAYHSTDGSSWEALGTPQMIPMASDVYIGLALCSRNVNATCTAEFSDVTTTGTVTGQWQAQDIGIESNTAEQLYVALQDSTNNSAVVKHVDPNATTIDTWHEWNIDLAEFTGVNMQSIRKMFISVGDRNNPQPGTSGNMYFDDIRLYPLREPEADLTGN